MTDPIFSAGFQGLSDQKRLETTAKELEAVVVSQVFTAMRKTVPDSGLFEKSEADDIFRSMLDDQLARVVADKGPFGLAKAVTKELATKVAKDGAAPAAAPSATPPAGAGDATSPAHAPTTGTAPSGHPSALSGALAAALAAHVAGAKMAPHSGAPAGLPKSRWRG